MAGREAAWARRLMALPYATERATSVSHLFRRVLLEQQNQRKAPRVGKAE